MSRHDFLGVAPALAPIVGGWLFCASDWHSIFWFLTGVGCVPGGHYRFKKPARQPAPFEVRHLMWVLAARFACAKLRLASGALNGYCSFICAVSARIFGTHMRLEPTEFYWFFCTDHCRHHGRFMAGAWYKQEAASSTAKRAVVIMLTGVSASICG
jgi:DHA1 family bicyclomycin/chloramphenicol resistance-like MFS transporter